MVGVDFESVTVRLGLELDQIFPRIFPRTNVVCACHVC